ncbi:MAG: type IX secretion system sortase PorU, partial [bacterium]
MGERFYKNALLNYDQARNWRITRRPKTVLSKQSDIFSSTLYRFTISGEGMYKIDGQLLETNNINLSDIDPAKIRLFNNGGRELPRAITAARPTGLVENAIQVVDGGDGRFDRDDYILFYGTGVEGWQYDPNSKEFKHYINHYESANVYWLSVDGGTDGMRMTSVSSTPPSGNTISEYLGMTFLEEELDNPLNSGLNWFGRQFRNDDPTETFSLDLPNAVTSEPMRLKIRFAPKGSGDHRVRVSVNGTTLGQRVFRGDSFGQYLRMRVVDFAPFEAANLLLPGVNSLELSYSHASDFAEAMLDWFELFYSARLSAVDNELAFTVIPPAGPQTYRISNLSDGSVGLFDISDFANVKQITGANFSNNSLTFTDVQQTTMPKRYLVAAISKYRKVEALERTEMTDLRNSGLAAEYIIITHDDFFNEAQRLESLRENGNPDNRLNTRVVRISDIYDNFSGGLMDPTAIRDFLKYAFENWRQPPSFEPPGYVLLFGDGDYDYKNRISSADKNWIPPFQTDELETTIRLEELVSRTTDSWFTYVSGNDAVMDIAIGRINARTVADAANMVDKIIDYETRPVRGKWRNTITMVGDDELVAGGRPSAVDNIHLEQAEAIIDLAIPKKFDIKKIYLSEFPKVLTSSNSGVTKPAAQDALISQINEGTLIVNFIGHGNPTVWAHEVVFQQSDNSRVQNIDKPVFFIAATCDWALFDDPTRESMAEDMIVAQRRGAIAILSASRLVFSRPNANFNELF